VERTEGYVFRVLCFFFLVVDLGLGLVLSAERIDDEEEDNDEE
jgi:hypothetical protein